MPSLKEIKGRIASVRSTLKITSAMKLVSSAKLRKAQKAIEAMRPYSAAMQDIMDSLLSAGARLEGLSSGGSAVVIVAIASNSSLCGAFNANVVRKVRELLQEYPDAAVYSVGRKVADAMRKLAYPSPEDLNFLAESAVYQDASALSGRFREAFSKGEIGKVILVYNHFESTSRQVTTAETLLPFAVDLDSAAVAEDLASAAVAEDFVPAAVAGSPDYIFEPSASEILSQLYPKVIDLRFFTALLDSAAAEHAARTVAMQIATDNGEDLLGELTLQYNKSRQQKITSEILDLAGGAAAEV